MPARTLTADDIAGMLGITKNTFLSKRRRLEDKHGFPPKLPGCATWSLPAVERWIRTNGATYLPGDPRGDQVTNIDQELIAARAAELAEEFGRSAA